MDRFPFVRFSDREDPHTSPGQSLSDSVVILLWVARVAQVTIGPAVP
jgi:hypothetical protein